MYNFVQREWDQFLSGIMRISAKCNFRITFIENGAKPFRGIWVRFSGQTYINHPIIIPNTDIYFVKSIPASLCLPPAGNTYQGEDYPSLAKRGEGRFSNDYVNSILRRLIACRRVRTLDRGSGLLALLRCDSG